MRYPLLSKFLSLGLILALISLVLMRIGFLVDERRGRQQEAVRSVEHSHAGAQALAGPWLQRHCSEEWEVISGEGKERKTTADKREFTLIATADTLAAEGDARAD
ncbi:inner membrane CreD family protein, partial [Aquabacterium sp.]|uniref:inner membrane CreD family protein n=1 Tax=Aquabacterium sp. TaxID=1872578 RepID=UPI002C7F4BCD